MAAGAEGAALARRLAQAWLANAHAGWQRSGAMAEKHDAMRPGQAGGGGEYAVQARPGQPRTRTCRSLSWSACRRWEVSQSPLNRSSESASAAAWAGLLVTE